MRRLACLTLLVLAMPGAALASGFQSCVLEGGITAAERDRASGVGAYAITVDVREARRNDPEANNDCDGYRGKPLQTTMVFPRGREPVVGATLVFERTAVDGVSRGQYVGTTVRDRFRRLRLPVPAPTPAVTPATPVAPTPAPTKSP